ncbi:MAG: class III signal peptide-containing protein [archaeon]
MINKFKKIIKEERAQISLEFLIILGIVALAAIAVGFYLKQVSAKNVGKVNTIQDDAIK